MRSTRIWHLIFLSIGARVYALVQAACIVEEYSLLVDSLKHAIDVSAVSAKRREQNQIEERNMLLSDLRDHVQALAVRNEALERAVSKATGLSIACLLLQCFALITVFTLITRPLPRNLFCFV